MTRIKISHRFLTEGDTISVDAKSILQINLRKIKQMFKFNYKTKGSCSLYDHIYTCEDLFPPSLHNDFTDIRILHDIDIANPIQLSDSVVTKTNITSESGSANVDLTLMDDYISYLKIHKPCVNVEKTTRRLNRRIMRQFYNALVDDKECALNILSKMYMNNPSDFDVYPPLNNDTSRKFDFPFKKNDRLLFVLTLESRYDSIKKRDYLVTLKII